MLKLTYHSVVFGPIDFEYEKPAIRVGSSEDNDLVLRHASVMPCHCVLVFRNENLVVLPGGTYVGPESDLSHLAGPEYTAGDRLVIGELEFSLSHSARTVAIPKAFPAAVEEAQVIPNEATYYCASCRRYYLPAEVKRFGLVGNPKRELCPKCSQLLVLSAEQSGRPAS